MIIWAGPKVNYMVKESQNVVAGKVNGRQI